MSVMLFADVESRRAAGRQLSLHSAATADSSRQGQPQEEGHRRTTGVSQSSAYSASTPFVLNEYTIQANLSKSVEFLLTCNVD